MTIDDFLRGLGALDIRTRVLDRRLLEYGLPQQHSLGSAGSDLRGFDLLVKAPDLQDDPNHLGYIRDPQMENYRSSDGLGYTLTTGRDYIVDTGLSLHINHRHVVGIVAPRSGAGSRGLVLANTSGVIDEDYQGRLILAVRPSKDFTYQPGERLCQIYYTLALRAHHVLTEAHGDETARGSGGYGSTGGR